MDTRHLKTMDHLAAAYRALSVACDIDIDHEDNIVDDIKNLQDELKKLFWQKAQQAGCYAVSPGIESFGIPGTKTY